MQDIINALKKKQIEIIESNMEPERYYYIMECLNEAILQASAVDKALRKGD
jgi:flagellar motility protein MotE (MotC chaperone)